MNNRMFVMQKLYKNMVMRAGTLNIIKRAEPERFSMAQKLAKTTAQDIDYWLQFDEDHLSKALRTPKF